MQYSYIIQAVSSRSNGYVSYSSNDYCLSDRVYRPSPCSCCVFPFTGVPSNPRFFNGFRQSSLIYLPAYRRLVLGGGDRFSQLPVCDFGGSFRGESCSVRNCCQCSCISRNGCGSWEGSCGGCKCGVDRRPVCCGRCYPIKESCGCGGVSRRRGTAGKSKCLGWEEKSERCDYGVECSPVCSGRCYPIKESRGYSGVDRSRRTEGKLKCLGWEEKNERCDSVTEELLNLLSEKDDENFVGHKEKKVVERISKVKRRKGVNKTREKYAESERLERDSRGVVKSVKKLSEEDYRSLGSKKSSRDESRELRKNVSNCSSYHSVMSSDESVESDVDVHVKHENFGGESAGTNKKESGRSFQEDVSVKKVIKQTEKNNDDADRYREVLRQRDAATQTTNLEVGSDLHVINEERKQLMDVSAQQGESRIESSNHKTGAETAFFSQKLRDDLVSKYSSDDTREQHIQMGGQIFQHDSSRINSQRLMEMSQIQDDDSERASSSKTHFRGREENLVASVNLFKGERDGHSQTGQIIGQSESRRYLQPRYRVLGSHNTDIRNTSTPWIPFESTSKIEDQRSTPTFHREEELDFQTGQPVGQETKPAEESVGLSTIAEINNKDTVILNETNAFGIRMSSQEETSGPSVPGMRTCTSQRLPESSWKNRHVSSTLLPSSCHDIEDQKVVLEQSSTKDSQDETNISRTLVSNTEIFGDPNKHYERRTSPREEISVSRMNLVQDTKQTQQETEQRIEQLESRKEFDKPTEVSGFWRTSVNRASSSQQLNPFQEASGKQINERQENERNSSVMVTPPPPQIIDVTPQYTVFHPKSPSKPSGEIYSELPGSGSTLVTQEIVQFPPSKDNIDEDQSTIPFYEDRLGSVIRLEESSSQFVRELVENLSHEVPTSEFPDKKVLPETTSSNKDELTQQCPNQATTEILHTQVDDSRKSSSRSGARGPSDEIWDVAGSFSEEPGMTEAPSEPGMTETPSEGNSTTKSTITKRGRSVWNIIGDIVRLRWSADSETHISKAKSGGKSSSNESVGSEAWFSSHEADEKGDENAKKGSKNTPKVHGSSIQHSLVNTEMLSLKGASEGTNLKNQILGIEADAVSSLDPQESNPASKSASSSSIVECTSQKLNESDSQQMLPGTTTSSSYSPLPSRHLIQSPAVKGEIPESGKGSVSRSDILQMEQPVQESQTDAIGTDMKDGDLHRRKLQRKKQVEKEHFEEWEEAYRLESEQRKIDEVFMKEALLEAKKAADTWEVPVGAVLVQDGKIIARGCNLVEDLRDSTAHAEMICIREASKTLRTWRLAETTLYVTLEPCAMCAGAILQARIDTVVYGAPNKLLGADGSWVRLFPGESEEGSSSSTNQTAGPVHPFHPKITIRRGVLATECADVMQQFFRLRRKKKSSNSPPTSSSSIANHPSKFISKLHDIFHIMYCL